MIMTGIPIEFLQQSMNPDKVNTDKLRQSRRHIRLLSRLSWAYGHDIADVGVEDK